MKHDIHVAVLIVGCGRFDCRVARQRGRLHVGQIVLCIFSCPRKGDRCLVLASYQADKAAEKTEVQGSPDTEISTS